MDHAESLRTIMEQLPEHYQPGQFQQETSFYFKMGDQRWTVYAGLDAVRTEEGKGTDQADCVLSTSTDFFIKMITKGYVPGVMDFMRGRIKTNDPDLLRRFKASFPGF